MFEALCNSFQRRDCGAGNAFISGTSNCITGGNAVSVWGSFNSSGSSS